MSHSTVRVHTDPPYGVSVGPGALAGWRKACEGADRVAIVADSRVHGLHSARLAGAEDWPLRLLPAGEDCKSWSLLGETLEFLADAGLSRRSTVLAFGGGAACDHAGLAASLFKRGCRVVHVPTTLLSQVDASVGGKTAINLDAGKNLAGTFFQPSAVLADTDLLDSLSDAELRSGLGEVLKTALLGGEDFLARLESQAEALLQRNPDALAAVVRDCVAIKADVVAQDPTEQGLRRALNLGHTFGHAIEHVAGYGAIPHGTAVAAGIGLALRAGVRRGSTELAFLERTRALSARLGLPRDLQDLRQSTGLALPTAALVEGLAHDKKGRVGAPEFILLDRPGAPSLGVSLDPALVEELFG